MTVGVGGLLAGWLFLRALTGETGTGAQPYLETVGFAITTPGGLVFLTYLSGVFRFDEYYTERGPAGIAGDFLLSVLAAVATGLLGTTVARAVTESPLTLFVVAATLTFVGALAGFVLRTRPYFTWEPSAAGS